MTAVQGRTVTTRFLQSIMNVNDPTPGSINPYTTVGAICWYVFLGGCASLLLCCCVGCSYIKLRKRRDEEDAITQNVMDSSLSRMEANIHVFSKQQELRRKERLLKAFEKHTIVLSAQHLDVSTKSRVSSKLSEGCSICLGRYEEGHVVVQSSTAACKHLFHRDCIASWLMTRQSPLCPCCRQTFIHGLYKRSLSTSSLSDDDVDVSEEATSTDDSSDSREEDGGSNHHEPVSTWLPSRQTESKVENREMRVLETAAGVATGEQNGQPESSGEQYCGQDGNNDDGPTASASHVSTRPESVATGEKACIPDPTAEPFSKGQGCQQEE